MHGVRKATGVENDGFRSANNMEDAAPACAHAKFGIEVSKGSDWSTLCCLKENRFRALMNEEGDNDGEEEPQAGRKVTRRKGAA